MKTPTTFLMKRVQQFVRHYRRIGGIHDKINQKALVIEMENFDYSVLFDPIQSFIRNKRTARQRFNPLYPKYFALNVNQKINERQSRNGLKINYLFATVLQQEQYCGDFKAGYPKINNGIYHHFGRNHSLYPTPKHLKT